MNLSTRDRDDREVREDQILTCESPISRFFVEEVRQEWNRIWPRHSLIVTFAYEKLFNKFIL